MLQLIYENVDITNDTNIMSAIYNERAGGGSDTLTITFSDSEDKWQKWNPQKEHEIELINDGVSTGAMFIDGRKMSGGIFVLKSISTPPGIKTIRNRTWENIRFNKIANDIAQSSKLGIELYGTTNYLYDVINQINETDLAFLNRLCIREGYVLKVNSKKIIIYSEKYLEQQESIKTFYKDSGKSIFEDGSDIVYAACQVKYYNGAELINYIFKPNPNISGEILKIDEQIYSSGEAERFAKSYLRNANKYYFIGSISNQINSKISAGNNINVDGIGIPDGKYCIYQIINDFTHNTQVLNVRKLLEGY